MYLEGGCSFPCGLLIPALVLAEQARRLREEERRRQREAEAERKRLEVGWGSVSHVCFFACSSRAFELIVCSL